MLPTILLCLSPFVAAPFLAWLADDHPRNQDDQDDQDSQQAREGDDPGMTLAA